MVTGVVLAELGNSIICVDTDSKKIKKLKQGISPIYEEDLEYYMNKNIDRIHYTTDYKMAYKKAKVIFICVGTPNKNNGNINLDNIKSVIKQIALNIKNNCIIVVKSTVPVGFNDEIEEYLNKNISKKITVKVVSNPEFLSQGTAVKDTLYASRIIVGTSDASANKVLKKIYNPLTKKPYNVPYVLMSRRSAELVKYASNSFLAIKISYINEIANFCEKVGANIEEVVKGMGFDSRIGNSFLNAGIGYGGSCLPKDTNAFYLQSTEKECELSILKEVINTNNKQKFKLYEKIKEDFKDLNGLNIAILGVTFKPKTDDLRETPAISNINLLLEDGANITAYDPVGLKNLKQIFFDKIRYSCNIEDAISNKDAVLILTEWDVIKKFKLEKYYKLMNNPIIYDGRNCYKLEDVYKNNLNYYSIGRKKINNYKK